MLELTHDHHNKTHGGVKDLLDLATSIKEDVDTIDNSQEEIKGKVKNAYFFLAGNFNMSHYYLSNQILNHFSANQDEFDGKIAEIACTIGSKSLEANTPASPRALVPKAVLSKFSNVICKFLSAQILS